MGILTKCIFETKFYGLKAHDQKAIQRDLLKIITSPKSSYQRIWSSYFSKIRHSSYKLTIHTSWLRPMWTTSLQDLKRANVKEDHINTILVLKYDMLHEVVQTMS